jgi:16S rRNA (guanine527-N7)-methyltransferase
LDSLGKRLRFIRQVVLSLGLKNVEIVQSRVEEYKPEMGFDCVLSRAFASLEDMLSWCHHLPNEKGYFLALKGQYPESEIINLDSKFEFLESITLQVPQLDGERCLVKVKRVS